jgi:PAS domain S-box-containing protein
MTQNIAQMRRLSTVVNLRLLVGWTIFCAAIAAHPAPTFGRVGSSAAAREQASSLPDTRTDPFPAKLTMVDGQDIRFKRLPEKAGLSQTRVSSVVQDNLGFIWFGTQYGLNRFDGYRSKVFKHEPGRSDSLSCVYIHSLFIDHSGTLWVGCEGFLDKFDPITETFTHYRINTPTTVITEDFSGILWLATGKGLYSLNPGTGQTVRYVHDQGDPASISGDSISYIGEDRSRRFWIGNSGGLDQFDRKTGKVIWHAPLRSEATHFHEDKFGVFWVATSDSSCSLATLNVAAAQVTCHNIDYESGGVTRTNVVADMLESRDGTMWLSSTAGLLRLDRQHKRIIRYHNQSSDNESLASDLVLSIYQDKEGNIWTCFQETEPNFFSEMPQAFETFTHQRGSLVNALVTSIYEDHNGILWIGSMGGLNRIDRRAGKNTVPAGSGVHNEILSILEDRSGLIFGTFHQGLQRIDPETGEPSPYSKSHEASNLANQPIMRLIIDHNGTLWAATYGSVSRFDSPTGNFIRYTLDKQNSVQYQEIEEDSEGTLWLGARSGLHRFDPRTRQFTVYEHNPDDPRSLSDNRVNSVHFDRSGNMWVGTQNGLDQFDPRTGLVKAYYQKDGLAGDVVSCILEDERGLLWMSTNKGLSSFDPQSHSFQSFSSADGLSGPDLTGWGACYRSPSGEMFFGGFSGATAFYPSRIVNNSFVPRTVLTEFRLSGNPVPIGPESPLKRSIVYDDSITLAHQQNMFSIEFSALSYFSAETNRYRYKLEGLDDGWHEVGSNQRTANYTTLPAGTYFFDVQGATSRGNWSEPGARLRIEILPPWWNTWWFRLLCAAAFLGVLGILYRLRIHQVRRQERNLRDVIETIPTFAWTALPDGSMDFVNRHWREYTGLSTENTVGSGWQDAVHVQDLERHIAKWRACLATGRTFETEVRYRRAADAEYRWFLTRAVPLRDENGRIVKWYGVSNDIEDRKRAEQLQTDLTHASRVSTMGELVASIAHELAQPITVTTAHARASLRWLERDPPDLTEVRKGTEKIMEAGALASGIINHLRSLYTKAPPKRELVAMNEVVGEMVGMMRGEARGHGVSIRTDLKDDLPMTVADRVQFQQVLMNLMLNGIEAMKDTGGVLTVKSQLREDGQIEISVKDTGAGLPVGKADQIFDAFFTTKPHGSGMGLAITKSIVESHGGRIWANGNGGRGATFYFTLPAAPAETNPPADTA